MASKNQPWGPEPRDTYDDEGPLRVNDDDDGDDSDVTGEDSPCFLLSHVADGLLEARCQFVRIGNAFPPVKAYMDACIQDLDSLAAVMLEKMRDATAGPPKPA